MRDLLESLGIDAGETGAVLAGFDFPIGVPAHFAERAAISNFLQWLPDLGTGQWSQFYSVCDDPGEISFHARSIPTVATRAGSSRICIPGLALYQGVTYYGLVNAAAMAGGKLAACFGHWAGIRSARQQ